MGNQMTITFTPELYREVENYREKKGFEKNPAAVRRLIRIGLDAEKNKND